MGNQVSRVYGFLVRRPLQRYNVENRAEKMINKFEDPNAVPYRAPMFKSDAQLLEELKKESPEIFSETVKKDDVLLQRLKSVYVDSTDPEIDQRLKETKDRPLPKDVRQHYVDFVPAQMRLERTGTTRVVPRGKVTLNQAVEMLTRNSQSSGKFGPQEISDEYRISSSTALNIIQHFEVFNMMETNSREDESVKPDPLSAGPDWESVKLNTSDAYKFEQEHMNKMIEKDKQLKLVANKRDADRKSLLESKEET